MTVRDLLKNVKVKEDGEKQVMYFEAMTGYYVSLDTIERQGSMFLLKRKDG